MNNFSQYTRQTIFHKLLGNPYTAKYPSRIIYYTRFGVELELKQIPKIGEIFRAIPGNRSKLRLSWWSRGQSTLLTDYGISPRWNTGRRSACLCNPRFSFSIPAIQWKLVHLFFWQNFTGLWEKNKNIYQRFLLSLC